MLLEELRCILRGDLYLKMYTKSTSDGVVAMIESLNKLKTLDVKSILDKYGKEGVSLLSKATPVDTGKTASSWEYQIVENKGRYEIQWYNTNIVNGLSIAILIQYGHGTRNGYYVAGVDYINPVLENIFDKIVEDLRKEVDKL